MSFETTSPDSRRQLMPLEESYTLNLGRQFLGAAPMAVSGQTRVERGTLVKLNADGTVSPVAGPTEMPFGVVVKGASPGVGYNSVVTVSTFFQATQFAVASGTVANAAMLSCTASDPLTGKNTFKTAVSGDWATAMAVRGGATTTEIFIGILRVPIKIA